MHRDTFERALHLWPDWGDSVIGNRQPLSYDLKWPQQECKDWANKKVTKIRKQDEAGLKDTSYSVPPDKVSSDTTYYWRVNAAADGKISDWSACWSFKTPALAPAPPAGFGTINVNATLDGSPWSGVTNYVIAGQGIISGSSVPQGFTVATGSWTIACGSGGPTATLVNITPLETQTLTLGSTITFTLDFKTFPTPGEPLALSLSMLPSMVLHGHQAQEKQ